MTGHPRGPAEFRGTLYPVQTYTAAARSISLLNVYAGLADGSPEAIVTEVETDQGPRGLLALTEAAALLFSMAVEDLAALPELDCYDVPEHVVGIFEAYGETPALARLLPRLLQAAGGATLDDVQALTAVLAEAGLTPAFPLGLARATVMVLRLIELHGTGIEALIETLEEQAFTIT